MTIFKHKNKVHMYDTDAAGILYFGNQFRFAHDAFEALLEHEGFSISQFFTESEVFFVIVHAEADYKQSLHLGDELEVQTSIPRLGKTSATFHYDVFRNEELVGTAQTVHVCIDKVNRKKQEIPDQLRDKLLPYLSL